jgi:hypothetical protein
MAIDWGHLQQLYLEPFETPLCSCIHGGFGVYGCQRGAREGLRKISMCSLRSLRLEKEFLYFAVLKSGPFSFCLFNFLGLVVRAWRWVALSGRGRFLCFPEGVALG